MITFICYPKCSTCKRAKRWLDEHHISYVERNIVIEPPTQEELMNWSRQYEYPIKKYFNTTGILYRQMNLKENLGKMDFKEQIKVLSSDGMLVKRPLLITEKGILIGFKENEWKEFFKEGK